MKSFAAVLLLIFAATGWESARTGSGPEEEQVGLSRQVRIPSGSYFVGEDNEADNRPCRSKSFTSFWIDIHPVTNARFIRFLDESGHRCRGAFRLEYARRFPDLPATAVTFADASAFAHFYGKRLPSEWEWEIAARSLEKENLHATVSPPTLATGNFFRFKQKNGVKAVLSYPPNPLGLYGMAGNVFEWTASPYTGGNLRGKYQADFRLMVLRGSAWTNIHPDARATKRTPFPASRSLPWLGFRCVQDHEPVEEK